METVTLRDGTVMSLVSCTTTMTTLHGLHSQAGTSMGALTALIDLRDYVSGEISSIGATCIPDLEGLALIEPGGTVHESVADVVRNALTGGPMDIQLVSPVGGEDS